MLKKALLSLTIGLAAVFPCSESSSQNIILPSAKQETASTSAYDIDKTLPTDFQRPLKDNIKMVIEKKKWQSVGKDCVKVSVSTLDGFFQTNTAHPSAVIYCKLTRDNPYFWNNIFTSRSKYAIDIFFFDLSDNTAFPYARVYMGEKDEILACQSDFIYWYIKPESKIANEIHKYLVDTYKSS